MSLARCGVPAAVALAVHGGISPAGGTAGAQLCSQAQHSSCDMRLPSGWEHPPSIGMPSGAVGQVGCLAFLRPLRQPCRGLGTLECHRGAVLDGENQSLDGKNQSPNASPCLADDESPGLYGFLHVIVHSAKGFKQSASKCGRLSLCVGSGEGTRSCMWLRCPQCPMVWQ